MGFLSSLFGKSPERPAYPTYNATQLQPLIDEYLRLARQGIGAQVPVPEEYGAASQTLQGLLGFQPPITQIQAPQEYGIASQALQDIIGLQPEQFQFPMEDIQKALAAQQQIQMQDYLKQIRPTLAAQGQLDSSYYTNLLGDFLQKQQAQTYGTTADLLTQQALQNLQLQQYFPQLRSGAAGQLAGLGGQQADLQRLNAQLQYLQPEFQSGIAGQLAGLGGQQAQLGLQNIMLPYQTTLPALQSGYSLQKGLEDTLFNQRLGAQQQEMGVYNQQKQGYDQMRSALAMAGIGAATGGLGLIPGLAGGMAGMGTGALGGLTGQLGTMAGGGLMPTKFDLGSLLGTSSTRLPTFSGAGYSAGLPQTSYSDLFNYQSLFPQQQNFNLRGGGQTVGARYFPQWSLQ